LLQLPLLRRFSVYAFTGLSLATGWIGYTSFELFEDRVERLETTGLEEVQENGALRVSLADLHRELGGLEEEAARLRDSVVETSTLRERIGLLECSLGDFQLALQHQNSDLDELRALRGRLDDGPVNSKLAELEHSLRNGRDKLDELVRSALDTGRRAETRLSELEQRQARERDLERRWQDLMGPTVQISGENSIGSGVLLASRPNAAGAFDNYLLTAWHVVRDIQGALEHLDMPVPVTLYARDGSKREVRSRLLRYDADIDAALLQLESDERLAVGAGLATRDTLARISVFQPVYAVGCPLGNDPIPTLGEVSSTQHEVDGKSYWMINAPTYIGNSGGGIFDAESHELIGIFSKIYNYGTSRPTVVPHMGLVVPLSKIYAWLDDVGYGELAGAPAAKPIAAAAPR
jgi:S1-C subfamily serine protease